jgi:hypothetical protein
MPYKKGAGSIRTLKVPPTSVADRASMNDCGLRVEQCSQPWQVDCREKFLPVKDPEVRFASEIVYNRAWVQVSFASPRKYAVLYAACARIAA